ncbi:MAG: phosphoribosyl-ATP diphosphatase [Hirschia sp.]|nr:phosphoribosyl-ATP diphosphatase [Hirschia sp.]MBF18901.1 phosphoribosyl-ATP diphosphatase [Hirschia sp.]|tara:strand:+ start:168 stop:524 length:357 start_codon:yes stop_codon:yes gene_type:complete
MSTPLSSIDRLSGALAHLATTIDARASDPQTDKPSWTAKLLQDGPVKCAKKLGEEGVEAALAIAAGTQEEAASEAADLLYHLFVALRSRGVSLDDVAKALEARQGISGVEEKAGRKNT